MIQADIRPKSIYTQLITYDTQQTFDLVDAFLREEKELRQRVAKRGKGIAPTRCEERKRNHAGALLRKEKLDRNRILIWSTRC